MHKVPQDSSIFHFTETLSAPSQPKLKDIITSCNVLHDTVINSCKGLNKDVQHSLAEFTSASASISQPRVRKWRSQARYSEGRNHILRLLSVRNRSKDEDHEEIFSQLLFRPAEQAKELTNRFKFSVPDVLSPRMLQLFKSNRRPFGGRFNSHSRELRAALSADLHEDSIADYLKEEIGKYNSNRMERLLRIPEPGTRKSVLVSTVPNSPVGRKRGSIVEGQPLYMSHKRFQKSPVPLPQPILHRRYASDMGDVEHTIMLDIKKARNDMAEVLRTEKLMIGAQVVQLGRFKAFKANLKDMAQRG